MNGRICYMTRRDRGAEVTGLRLVTGRGEEDWRAPDQGVLGFDESLEQSVRQAAGWLRERLSSSRGGRRLDRLVLDVDGGVCSWVTPPGGDPSLVRTVVEGGPLPSMDPDDDDAGNTESGPSRFPDLPGELGVQALVARGTRARRGTPSRVGALAIPDVPARLLIAALDTEGVRIDAAVSLWHAMALCWDPGSVRSGSRGERVVAEETGPTAVVLLDPSVPRLVWTWSHAGGLIAAGATRLTGHSPRPAEGEGGLASGGPCVVTEEDAGKLAAAWLSWSAQLGVAPQRVVIVGRLIPALDAAIEAVAGPRGVGTSPSLSAGELTELIERRWPGASVTHADEDDPIGATLVRLGAVAGDEPTGAGGGGRTELTELTTRPGRAHRGMYRWTALALVALAIAVFAGAWRVFGAAGEAHDIADQAQANRRALLEDIDPGLIVSPSPDMVLESRISELRRGTTVPDAWIQRDILPEVDAISFVIGYDAVDMRELNIGPAAASLTLVVDNIAQGEELVQALRDIGGAGLQWPRVEWRTEGNRVIGSVTGQWRTNGSGR